MSSTEIREYDGDFEDVAELAGRAFSAFYGGITLFVLWDAAFLRWQLRGDTPALLPAAYDGSRLVGTLFSIPHSLRIGSTILPIGICSWLAVAPEYQRSGLAVRLTEALRQSQDERGLVCSLVMSMGDPPLRKRYIKTHPQNFCHLFKFGLWVKVLAPGTWAQASVEAWMRLMSRAFGSVFRLIPQPYHPNVRPYRAEDLEACALLLEKATAKHDWALLWPMQRLGTQLESPVSRTLVLDRDGRLQGFVNYHFIVVQGRKPVRAAMIDLWADDNLSAMQRIRFLGHVCQELRARNVELVFAPRCAMMPVAAFAANLFFPTPRQFHLGSIFTKNALPPSPPRSWSLLVR